MRSFSASSFVEALGRCSISNGDVLLVHSSLIHLGRLEGCSSSEGPGRLYELLRGVIGEEGTVVVPAFNFGFCRGEAHDPRVTPSHGMGAFSEFVRTLPGALRSPHPMQSVAAVGPAARAICANETRSSFDPGGPFATLLDLEATGLLLGAPMQAFSLVHLAEERLEVPYRHWKEFTAPYGESEERRTFAMYVRDLELDPRLELSRIEQGLAAQGGLRSAPVGGGRVQAFALTDFMDVTLRGLARDPHWLLKEKR
jgi:aminoglycoside N3'-acetyltransferase